MPESQSFAQANDSSHTNPFLGGLTNAFLEPFEGMAQLVGKPLPQEKSAPAFAHESVLAGNAGSLVGNAAIFYAAATSLRALPGAWGEAAPILAGAGLGFISPTANNDFRTRIKNGLRGAATMTIIEKMPGKLRQAGLCNDFAGQIVNAVATGAAAGGVDANAQSLWDKGQFADWQTTTSAALSWGATGAAFHLGSLGLGKSFRKVSDSSHELFVIAGKDSVHNYPLRNFLNGLSTDGIKYRTMEMGTGAEAKPTVLFADGTRVDGTDLTKLSQKLNLHTAPDYDHYRVAIIGSGPAGVQSAINAASELPEGQHVALLGEVAGGQARFTSSVKNYMGFPDVTGAELMTRGIQGAKARGAEMIINRVNQIETLTDGRKLLTLRDGKQITADAVTIGTGQTYNQLNVPGIERLENKGVYTLADANELEQMKGKKVFIVGAGNSAGQAAINFARRASEVHILARRDLTSSMSEYLIREIGQKRNIIVHTNSEVADIDGGNNLESVTVKTKEGEGYTKTQMKADGMYVYIGGKPNTGFLKGSGIQLNDKGFILTGRQLSDTPAWTLADRAPLDFETSTPGVFAAGDVNAANPQKRIVSAVGDAGKLIGSLHTYLSTVPLSQSVRVAPDPSVSSSRAGQMFKIPLTSLGGGMLQAAHVYDRY